MTISFSFSWSFAFRSIICCEFSPLRRCNSVSSSCWVSSFCSRHCIFSWRRLSPPPARSPSRRSFSFCIDSCKFSCFRALTASKILLSGGKTFKTGLRLGSGLTLCYEVLEAVCLKPVSFLELAEDVFAPVHFCCCHFRGFSSFS